MPVGRNSFSQERKDLSGLEAKLSLTFWAAGKSGLQCGRQLSLPLYHFLHQLQLPERSE